jgi:hypothetical protein
MTEAACSDQEFIQLFELYGAKGVAERTNCVERGVYARRRRLEKSLSLRINAPGPAKGPTEKYKPRVEIDVKDGVVLIGSDAHYWPGASSTAHRAFVDACKRMDPAAVIMNGDVFDGANVSRHPPGMWESLPTVEEELEVCKERLWEIQDACPDAKHIWTLGNHDARFENKLATMAPEFAGVHGMHLKDHFPDWRNGWACWINDEVVVKHKWKGGVHATHNNAVGSGKTMVTAHLHSLKVTPYNDYNGIRYGVDTGTLSDLGGAKFSYGEDNPTNHRSGFAVLTFRDGRLMWPEVVSVIEPGKVEFRAKIYDV